MSSLAIRSFAKGELAPALHARTDLAAYEIGLRQCRNWLVMRQGGATKRPGTEFICAVKDATTKTRLVPFIFNTQQALVLEFGDQYVRFIQNGGQVADPDEPSEPYEIASPYTAAHLFALQFVQSADVVTIVHPSYPPQELKRFGSTNWTLTPIVFGPDVAPPATVTVDDEFMLGPADADPAGSYYAVTALSATGDESLMAVSNLSPHKPTSTVPQRVQGTATGAVTYNVYRRDGGAVVYGFIGSGIGETIDFTDTGYVPEFALQPPIDKSALFASSDHYPSAVAYYQQRLVFANTNTDPNTVWMSRTGYYHNFNISSTAKDDDAVTFRLVSDELDAIKHVLNLGRLIIGTEGADWIVDGDGSNTITPFAIGARIGSYDGMSSLRPVKTGSMMLFVQAMGAAVRELQSDSQGGAYGLVGGDVTIYSSHLVDGYGLVDWTWQQEPLHLVWAVRSDGVLLGLTYIPEQQTLAWHRHDTKGFIEAVCVVPEGRAHYLYVIVKRLINGAYVRYIERMTTTNVVPVFATPEEGASGAIVTPPAPPGGPAPSTTPVPPPTNAETTDITATGATANWINGSTLAPTEIAIHPVSDTAGLLWVTSSVPGGTLSYPFTGLTPSVAYEWKATHVLSGVRSSDLGPTDAATQFTTSAETPTLAMPSRVPSIINTVSNSGSTDVTISWPVSPDIALAEVSIAGPLADPPSESDFSQVGVFAADVTTAIQRVEHGGTYWLRVRYTKAGFADSAWAGPAQVVIGVLEEV